MAKIIYYVAATMDGYIATEQHQLDFLQNFTLSDDATPFNDFYNNIGAVIIGARTYCWIIENSPNVWPYKNIPAFVVTQHNLPVATDLNITLIQGKAQHIAIQAKHAANNKDVWVVGGGKTAAYFAEARELQQLFVTTIPVFLGHGITMLPVSHSLQVIPQTLRILQNGAIEYIANVQYD